ncbi:tetrapyrrole biosynthesis, uroporphyrinogen III synthase [Kalaharituber pfeilii]|nr:tetrapyrrole biosynthesis, uroporphyrinogen III synthase [Kalaharituber pfeilii]
MAASNPQQVLLLKTRSHPKDPYDVLLRSKNVEPIFVPVLEHRHVNLDTVGRIITEGRILGFGRGNSEAEYGGIIITSQRAVEALASVLGTLKDTISPDSSTHPIYVVGPATQISVVSLGFPASNVHGADCGNGAALAQFIVNHYKLPKKLLFLVGEIRRDVIPKTLTGAGKTVDEVVVYDTEVMSSFREDFIQALKLGDAGDISSDSGRVRWVVIFSPTGSETAMEVLGRTKSSSTAVADSGRTTRNGKRTYVATIGPTTAAHLQDVIGIEPDAVAGKPSPEGLWESMEAFLKK